MLDDKNLLYLLKESYKRNIDVCINRSTLFIPLTIDENNKIILS